MKQQVTESEVITNQIYDIYVIKTSGVPLFAGCTATDYCKAHMGQHELISGFFSALLSFSEETFEDENLETMIYNDILLNFWKDEEHDLIFVFVHDRKSDLNVIREHLNRAHQIFIDEYEDHLDSFSVNQTIFENYREILREKGLITNLVDTSDMMEVKEKHKESKPSLLGWIKNLFN